MASYELNNRPIIEFLSNYLGCKDIADISDKLADCTFNARGINYCVMIKPIKGYIEGRF